MGNSHTLAKKWDQDVFNGTIELPKKDKKIDNKTAYIYDKIDKALKAISKKKLQKSD